LSRLHFILRPQRTVLIGLTTVAAFAPPCWAPQGRATDLRIAVGHQFRGWLYCKWNNEKTVTDVRGKQLDLERKWLRIEFESSRGPGTTNRLRSQGRRRHDRQGQETAQIVPFSNVTPPHRHTAPGGHPTLRRMRPRMAERSYRSYRPKDSANVNGASKKAYRRDGTIKKLHRITQQKPERTR